MPRGLIPSFTHRAWWWVFGLFIATPALVLALLGLQAIRAREIEREQGLRDQATVMVQDNSFVSGGGAAVGWSADGTKVYYRSRDDRGRVLERDLGAGTDREIIRHPFLWNVHLSPDGRYFAVKTTLDPSAQSSSLLLVPIAGGPPRELLRLTAQETLTQANTTSWLPDSHGVMVAKKAGRERSSGSSRSPMVNLASSISMSRPGRSEPHGTERDGWTAVSVCLPMGGTSRFSWGRMHLKSGHWRTS